MTKNFPVGSRECWIVAAKLACHLSNLEEKQGGLAAWVVILTNELKKGRGDGVSHYINRNYPT